MGVIKRVKVSSFILFIVFAGITTLVSNVGFARPQAVVGPMGQQMKRLKTAANGITDSTGSYKYAILEDGTAEIIQYLKEEETVKIPAVLDGHTVTVIGKAFCNQRSVSNIDIPDTVTGIGSDAFWGTGIKQITIPESVIRIGNGAFGGCLNLESLYIPQNVEKIEGNIIQSSNNVAEIEVDSHNAIYASVDGVLYNKDLTELLTMPGGKDMAGFQIPESVVRIGSHAFQSCEHASFTELVIPDSVTALESAAIASCRGLKRVVMGENVTVIGGSAFSGCNSLSEVILNGKLRVIGSHAFSDCYDLAKINIPDSVIEIGDSAFYNCGSLKDISIPKSVTKIGDRAIARSEDCIDDGRIVNVCITGYKNTAARRYAKSHWVTFRDAESGKVIRYDLIPVPKAKIKKLTAGAGKINLLYDVVPDAVYQIAVKKAGASVWKRHDAVKTSAVIKGLASGKQYKVRVRALRKIDGKYYYGKWSSVKKIKVRAGAALALNDDPVRPQAVVRPMGQQAGCLKTAANERIDSTGDYQYVVLQDGTAKIIKYLRGAGVVKIPAALDGHQVTAIGAAFYGKRLITGIEIPDTVTDIGVRAFSGTGIIDITIPESVLRIGDHAFGNCENLERLYIPQNVEKIEGNIVPFSGRLAEIEVDSHNASYASVDGVLYDKDVTELLAVPGGKDMARFQIPESIVRIGSFAFSFCNQNSFTDLVIPYQVKTLGFAAFIGCRHLERVIMGRNVTTIGNHAFSGCGSLSEVILNGKLKIIEENAFYGCYHLTKIGIPDSVIEIGESAFEDCEHLTDITVGKSVAKIGRQAFAAYSKTGVRYNDVCITGYKNTVIHRYAKEVGITFRDAESGKVIRYDLILVPSVNIKKLTDAGTGKIRLVYQAAPHAAYQIAVKKAGASVWKRYDTVKTSAVIKGLTPSKQYKVRVRALRKIDGEYYYSGWSGVKKIKVR